MTYQLFRMHVAFTIQKLIMSFCFFFFSIGEKSVSVHQLQGFKHQNTFPFFFSLWNCFVLGKSCTAPSKNLFKTWSLNRLIHLHNYCVNNKFLNFKHFYRKRKSTLSCSVFWRKEKQNIVNCRGKINKTQP